MCCCVVFNVIQVKHSLTKIMFNLTYRPYFSDLGLYIKFVGLMWPNIKKIKDVCSFGSYFSRLSVPGIVQHWPNNSKKTNLSTGVFSTESDVWPHSGNREGESHVPCSDREQYKRYVGFVRNFVCMLSLYFTLVAAIISSHNPLCITETFQMPTGFTL